jgi:hypothetical protein
VKYPGKRGKLPKSVETVEIADDSSERGCGKREKTTFVARKY